MKKLWLFGISVFIASSAFGSTLTVPNLSSDSDVNIQYFNNFSSAVESVVNGNIESANIKDATITVDDMASSSSTAQREGDHFNAYTKTGMLPVTDATLTSNISAGTSYVKSDAGLLYRVVTASTAHTYTATKDTYVYIDKNGAFQYSEVTVGAGAPTTPADSLLLAKVTTNGTAITTVTDSRTLSINFGTSGNEDYAIKGFEIRADNTAKCSADAGVVYHGSTRIKKTTFTNLTVATATDWWDGVVDTGTAGLYYIGIDATGSIKFLGINPPNKVDTSANTQGTKHYWYDGTKYWRVIGQITVTSGNVVIPHRWSGTGDRAKISYEDPADNTNLKVLNAGSQTSFTAVDCSAVVPATATIASLDVEPSAALSFYLRPTNTGSAAGLKWTVGSANDNALVIGDVPLNSSRSLDYKVSANNITVFVTDYTIDR